MGILLTVLAVVVALIGIVNILQGSILWGVILLILAAAIGPGGWSVFSRRW